MGSLLKVISSGSVLNWIEDILGKIVEIVIGPILWGLCDIFFIILELFDTLYKNFAGIEDFVEGKEMFTQDPVLYFINTSLVQEIFFSIVILSLILLIIFTIFAVVKNIYVDKPKPIGEILSSSVKGLLMYLLVPVATVVCLLVGNVVLRAIDGATRGDSAKTSSDVLFMSAAYSANKLRDTEADREKHLKWMMENGRLNVRDGASESAKQNYIRQLQAANVEPEGIIDYDKVDYELAASAIDEAFLAGVIYGGSYSGGVNSKWALGSVQDYYNILNINLITVWAGGAFMIFAMGKITWGLISRMFKMTVYFAISPALMAMYPIDGGKAVGSWRQEMVKNGTMAYCAIGVLNVVLSILPVFSQIKFFPGGGWNPANSLTSLFITIVALTSAEKMIGTVSGWFGTGDAFAEGKAASKAVTDPAKKAGKKALGAFVGGLAARKQAKDMGANVGGQIGALVAGSLGVAGLKNPLAKEIQDAKKAGKEKYKEMTTTNLFTGDVNKIKAAKFEARERIKSEDDEIKVKLEMADQVKQAQLDKLDENDPAYEAKKAEIENYWKKAADKIKSSATYLSDLFAIQEEEIKAKTKQRDKQQSALQTVGQYSAALSQDADLKNSLLTQMKAKKHAPNAIEAVENNWEQVKTGNFSNIDGLKGVAGNFVSKWVAENGSEIRLTDRTVESAKSELTNLIQTGGGKAIGGISQDLYKELLTSATGKPGEQETINANINVTKLADEFKKAQSSINETTKSLKAMEDALEDDKAKLQGLLLTEKKRAKEHAKQIETIAKNSKKK